MALQWRVADCSDLQCSIRSLRGQILVEAADRQPTYLPVAELAVLLVGPSTQLSTGVLHLLANNDVAVLVTDWRRIPVSALHTWGKHTRVGARTAAQVAASQPKKKALWASIVKAKIRGQANVLKALERRGAPTLENLARQVRSGDPGNLEAQAARLYWECLYADQSFARQPGSGEGANACLDYGYAILRGVGIRAVFSAGLSPTIGVFHRGRSNAFNLVDDLIEPFRPVVDQITAGLPGGSSPEAPGVKRLLVSSIDRQFTSTGLSVAAEFERLAQAVGRYYEGDVARVNVNYWGGNLGLATCNE
ncbi:type II CRISPR-associated endonuclease Cas1 [Scrofimicrobium sp. R131]|uniref:CRISPR-associated endonuclease Cas1 n=1 Tax=Scrofimicrobium appendicitidis TaxID=3079930 RepID=A0AAU7V9A8_9ACTO